MPYPVNHSDVNKGNFTTVNDQVINQTSSLSFVGKNYTGYGQIMAENFLHLLENFANSTEPLNPVEGQLWYDNTENINLLKIYNGTNWNPAGAIKKASTPPVLTESVNGDLWVNPNTKQLFMFSGTSWDLIGPQFSSGLKTGPLVDIITDTADIDHTVVTIYAQNERILIISQAEFIPKLFIDGFSQLNKGINFSTANQNISFTKLWGTAESADGLIVNGSLVNSDNFLRSDVPSSTTKSFKILSNEGISIGTDSGFQIIADELLNLVRLTEGFGKSISVDFGNVASPAVYIKSNLSVGIRNSSPTEALDVNGNILTNGKLIVTSTTDSTSLTTGSIISSGGLAVSKRAIFGSTTQFNNTISVYKATGGSVILPDYTGLVGAPLYDIGHSATPFRDVYAQKFVGILQGDVTGDVTGNVYGTASSLQDTQLFSIVGDISCDPVPFNGLADVELTATISPDFMSTKNVATKSLDTDEILTYRPSTGMERTSKKLLLKSVPVVPAGAIMPYAGITAPIGYLLCDGSEVPIDSYPALFDIIKYSYRNKAGLLGDNTFALPDLRGRFPLGRDNMDNGLMVTTPAGLPIRAGGTRNGAGNPPADPANRVRHSSASTLGAGFGSEAFGTPAVASVVGSLASISSTNGPTTNIMNPYQTINYIIFTGVLQ